MAANSTNTSEIPRHLGAIRFQPAHTVYTVLYYYITLVASAPPQTSCFVNRRCNKLAFSSVFSLITPRVAHKSSIRTLMVYTHRNAQTTWADGEDVVVVPRMFIYICMYT